MPVISHHCSRDRRGTRKQWDQALPTPRHHAAGRCAKEAGVFPSCLSWSAGSAPWPPTNLGNLGPSLFSSAKPCSRSLPQHMGHEGSSPQLQRFQTHFSHLSQQSSLPTQRDGCSALEGSSSPQVVPSYSIKLTEPGRKKSLRRLL